MQALIIQNCLPTFAYTSRIKTIKQVLVLDLRDSSGNNMPWHF